MWNIVLVNEDAEEKSITLPYNFAYQEDAQIMSDCLQENCCAIHKVVERTDHVVLGFPGVITRQRDLPSIFPQQPQS